MQAPSRFWTHWLLFASASVVAFGLVLVIAPSLSRQAFSLLVYASPMAIDSFGPEQTRYISLSHAVIGSVMVGWGVALFYITQQLFATGNPLGRKLIAISIAAWFLPDTGYSLVSGYWQNAVLNAVFLAMFALPLWATRASRAAR